MVSKRRHLLNKFLLACIFLGIIMILIKEKEGFASHYHNIDNLYKGSILDKIETVDDTYMAKNLIPNLRDSVVRIKKYSEMLVESGTEVLDSQMRGKRRLAYPIAKHKEGIYVRGGDASEAKQIVDGMLIQNPYFSDVPDIPQRGRFEPFDFRGTAFSQG